MEQWAKTDAELPNQPARIVLRNQPWFHLCASDILLMPDKWEYPWFAAWDHAFHASVAVMVDIDVGETATSPPYPIALSTGVDPLVMVMLSAPVS
ncbi:MAG: hypothetical protein SNJ85_04910 [Cyanobacteriota bacterium]